MLLVRQKLLLLVTLCATVTTTSCETCIFSQTFVNESSETVSTVRTATQVQLECSAGCCSQTRLNVTSLICCEDYSGVVIGFGGAAVVFIFLVFLALLLIRKTCCLDNHDKRKNKWKPKYVNGKFLLNPMVYYKPGYLQGKTILYGDLNRTTDYVEA